MHLEVEIPLLTLTRRSDVQAECGSIELTFQNKILLKSLSSKITVFLATFLNNLQGEYFVTLVNQ